MVISNEGFKRERGRNLLRRRDEPREEKWPGGVEGDVHHRRAVAPEDSDGIGRWSRFCTRHWRPRGELWSR